MTSRPVRQERAYDGKTIALHWLTALLVAGQWLGAHTIDWFARGWPRTDARSLHIVVGVMLAMIIIWRLVWRRTGGRRLPPADGGVLGWLALLVHLALYALVIATGKRSRALGRFGGGPSVGIRTGSGTVTRPALFPPEPSQLSRLHPAFRPAVAIGGKRRP